MADAKFSALTAMSTFATDDIVPVVDTSAVQSKQATMAQLATYLATLMSVSGSITVVPITISDSPYTVIANSVVILVNATGGAVTVIADATSRQNITIKKTDSSANAVTFDPTSSQTVEGASTAVLTIQGSAISLASDASNWSIF